LGKKNDLSHLCEFRSPLQSYHFFALNHFIELELRWGHPGQQHGRLLPAPTSTISLLKWFSLVSGLLTIVTQQIHSSRATGVRLFHLTAISLLPDIARIISSGKSWMLPSDNLSLDAEFFGLPLSFVGILALTQTRLEIV
jgi:hypothetical protein